MKHIPSTLLLMLVWFVNGQKEIPYRQLQWEDFRCLPDTASADAAKTMWEWVFTTNEEDSVYSFSVKCYFLPLESWTKTRSPYILSHEQAHFQLAEAHCRQLQKALAAIGECRHCKETVDSMYDAAYKAACDAQISYDEATGHSRNKAAQAEWNLKIAKEIQP